ncbi:MAG: RNA polymerase sigma-70 factor [Arenicellales bacterium]
MHHRADEFQQHRPRLYGIAYRMLGSRTDAEDMLQEAYLRWHQTDVERVRVPEAWLTTIVTRLCIDRLRATRSERESYVGPWLPEPLVGAQAPPPETGMELASDLSVALLVVLERLAPEERAAFLLHDVFDCGYADIARILSRNEASCRQLVHRARKRVRADRPRFDVSESARRKLLERFASALKTRNQDALLALFAPDATWVSDGGGKAKAARKAIRGSNRIARFVIGVWRRNVHQLTTQVVPINGEDGLLMYVDGRPKAALSIHTDGVCILAAYTVLNPDKLEGIQRPEPRIRQ